MERTKEFERTGGLAGKKEGEGRGGGRGGGGGQDGGWRKEGGGHRKKRVKRKERHNTIKTPSTQSDERDHHQIDQGYSVSSCSRIQH